jgi:hypothetical protein
MVALIKKTAATEDKAEEEAKKRNASIVDEVCVQLVPT